MLWSIERVNCCSRGNIDGSAIDLPACPQPRLECGMGPHSRPPKAFRSLRENKSAPNHSFIICSYSSTAPCMRLSWRHLPVHCPLTILNVSELPSSFVRKQRILRDRLAILLEVAAEVWSANRRPWEDARTTFRSTNVASQSRSKKTGKRRQLRTDVSEVPSPKASRRRQGMYLDSGAGPRRFWEAICGPRFVDTTWEVDDEVRSKSVVGQKELV